MHDYRGKRSKAPSAARTRNRKDTYPDGTIIVFPPK